MVFALAGDSTITSLVPGFASVFLVVRFAAGFLAADSPSSALAALVLVVVFFVVAFLLPVFRCSLFCGSFFCRGFFRLRRLLGSQLQFSLLCHICFSQIGV